MTRSSSGEYTARRERVMEFVTRPSMQPLTYPWDNDTIEMVANACECSKDYVRGLQWRMAHPEKVDEYAKRSNTRRKARLRRQRLKEAKERELATAEAPQQLEMPLTAVVEAPQQLPPPPPVIHVDMVNRPSHYTDGGIETIDYIRAKLTRDEYIGYLRGNIFKYTSRLGKKDGMAQDAGKLAWYSRELETFLGGGN